jgi:hypothetical protein
MLTWFRKLSRLLSQPGFSVVDYFQCLSVIRTIQAAHTTVCADWEFCQFLVVVRCLYFCPHSV